MTYYDIFNLFKSSYNRRNVKILRLMGYTHSYQLEGNIYAGKSSLD